MLTKLKLTVRVTIIMSWKICVLSEMEIVKDVRKFAEYSQIRVSMDIEVNTNDELRWRRNKNFD